MGALRETGEDRITYIDSLLGIRSEERGGTVLSYIAILPLHRALLKAAKLHAGINEKSGA